MPKYQDYPTATPEDGDILLVLDVSDTTDGAAGTTKKAVVNGLPVSAPQQAALDLKLDIADHLAFKTVAVAGQGDIVADSAADTLTLVAGANITLTTDAAADSVTIASTGGGGGGEYALSGDNADITSLQNLHGPGGVLSNTGAGLGALNGGTIGAYNTAFGVYTLAAANPNSSNVAVGAYALSSNTGFGNAAVGSWALADNTTGESNSAVGDTTLSSNISGSQNVAVGAWALNNNMTGWGNVALGVASLINNNGTNNVAVGLDALSANTTGGANVAVGYDALHANVGGSVNTAIGAFALNESFNYSNCSGVGCDSQVTGSNQVQIGDSATTTYVYGTVQNRSDERDKADIRDTVLGLGFINALRPVDYKWDMRDFYKPAAPDRPKLRKPTDAAADNYGSELAAYEMEQSAYSAAHSAWLIACRLENIIRDGTNKRSRYHHGVLAQDVQKIIKETGGDFGGLQDHSINGGEDVLSIGYDELVAPLIKAVQELSARLAALEKLMSH